MRLLLHPAFLVAVGLLALNDHVLKEAFPGLLTGKLSDLAGVFVVGMAAVTAIPARVLALSLVAVLFIGLKITPGVAEFIAPSMGGAPTLQDASDLIALAALWPVYRIALHHAREPDPRATLPRRLALSASLLAMVATTTATSCAESPTYWFRENSSGLFLMRNIDGSAEAISTDGGASWRPSAESYEAPSSPELRRRSEAILKRHQACTEEGHCFRVAQGLYVEERSPGGDWHRTFEFTPEERRNARLHEEGIRLPTIPWGPCGGSPDPRFGYTFSAVTVVDVNGEEHAVVAMGSQGALHKVVGGEWERVPVGNSRPVRTDEPSWLTFLRISLIGSAAASTVLTLAGLFRRRDPVGRHLAIGGLLFAATSLLLSTPLVLARFPPAGLGFAYALVLALACVALLVADPTKEDRAALRERLRSLRRTGRSIPENDDPPADVE